MRPTSNGAETEPIWPARRRLDELVLEARASGTTVLLASHEADRACALADRVLEIDGGANKSPAGGVVEAVLLAGGSDVA